MKHLLSILIFFSFVSVASAETYDCKVSLLNSGKDKTSFKGKRVGNKFDFGSFMTADIYNEDNESITLIDTNKSVFLIFIQKKKRFMNFVAINTHASPPILTDFYQGPCKVY